MRDNFSTDVETAARLAAYESDRSDTPSWREAERENQAQDFRIGQRAEDLAWAREMVARDRERGRRWGR